MFGCLIACFKKKNKSISSKKESLNKRIFFNRIKFSRREFNRKEESQGQTLKAEEMKVSKKQVYTLEKGSIRKPEQDCYDCTGKECEAEDWTKWKDPVVRGLCSSTFKNNIILSQRPSSRLIKEFEIEKQLVKLEVGLIVNCQSIGEHPNCGDGIKNSGFSYSPNELSLIDYVQIDLLREIRKRNFKALYTVLRQIAQNIVAKKQKVFIHCHSGNEQSCLLAALYLVFTEKIKVEDTITMLHSSRKQVNLNASQTSFCSEFRDRIVNAKIVFPFVPESIEEFIKKQQAVLFMPLEGKLAFTPRIITVLLERLVSLTRLTSDKKALTSLLSSDRKIDFNMELKIGRLKKKINEGNWTVLEEITDISLLVALLENWCMKAVKFVVNPVRAINICRKRGLDKRFENVIDGSELNKQSVLRVLNREFRKIEYFSLCLVSEFLFESLECEETEEFEKIVGWFASILSGEKLVEDKKWSSVADCLKFLVYLLSEGVELFPINATSKDNSINTGKDSPIKSPSKMTNYLQFNKSAESQGSSEKSKEGIQEIIEKLEGRDKLAELKQVLRSLEDKVRKVGLNGEIEDPRKKKSFEVLLFDSPKNRPKTNYLGNQVEQQLKSNLLICSEIKEESFNSEPVSSLNPFKRFSAVRKQSHFLTCVSGKSENSNRSQ